MPDMIARAGRSDAPPRGRRKFEGADVAIDAARHRVGGDAESAENLQRAVDYAAKRLVSRNTLHRLVSLRARSRVEQPGRIAKSRDGKMQVGGIVSKLETHA